MLLFWYSVRFFIFALDLFLYDGSQFCLQDFYLEFAQQRISNVGDALEANLFALATRLAFFQISVDRVKVRNSDLRLACFRALTASGAEYLAGLVDRDSLVTICARSYRAATLQPFQARFSGRAQAYLCADATDYARFFVRFKRSNFFVSNRNARLADHRAIATARTAGNADNFSNSKRRLRATAPRAIRFRRAQAINAHAIAACSDRFECANFGNRSSGNYRLFRRYLSACQARLAFWQANVYDLSAHYDGSKASQVTAATAINLERGFDCRASAFIFFCDGLLKDCVGRGNERRARRARSSCYGRGCVRGVLLIGWCISPWVEVFRAAIPSWGAGLRGAASNLLGEPELPGIRFP